MKHLSDKFFEGILMAGVTAVGWVVGMAILGFLIFSCDITVA